MGKECVSVNVNVRMIIFIVVLHTHTLTHTHLFVVSAHHDYPDAADFDGQVCHDVAGGRFANTHGWVNIQECK
jgi:hypothetical protein